MTNSWLYDLQWFAEERVFYSLAQTKWPDGLRDQRKNALVIILPHNLSPLRLVVLTSNSGAGLQDIAPKRSPLIHGWMLFNI